ncbi:MAG: fasciclin domain-containing protein [Prolixibacteraceae bacterium]|nr:fasciclin domain-containing protein [Prolixibacteraceae bacterium]
MRKLIFYIALFSSMFFIFSCDEGEPVIDPGFEDMERLTIYDYIVENDSLFSKFNQILVAGNLDKTMAAYNPNGDDYTMFLPTNEAIDEFIANNKAFASFEDLLNDKAYVESMARYHVVNLGIITNEFPFGALPSLNLTGQYLTVQFEIGEDSSYYKINNEAPVIQGNIEVSNGWVHVISKALTPVNYTAFQWLEQTSQFSIFAEAVRQTGFDEVLSRVVQGDTVSLNPVTLFVEPDSVYQRSGINSFDDLAKWLSPGNSEYTNPYNSLYNYVGYHILDGSLFLSDFEEDLAGVERVSTNYSTYGNAPVNINDMELDLLINRGRVITDTMVSAENDTTFSFLRITFYYDLSNNLTQSGAVHIINEVMTPQKATAQDKSYEFWEEPLFYQFRLEGGEFVVEDQSLLSSISWTGKVDEIYFVKSDDEDEQAWNRDYLRIDGDFSINYKISPLAPGTYEMRLRAHSYNSQNALVEVYLDGVKIGGLIDLTSSGSVNWPYYEHVLGEVTFLEYSSHDITVQSLIPGIFIWDVVIFEKED